MRKNQTGLDSGSNFRKKFKGKNHSGRESVISIQNLC